MERLIDQVGPERAWVAALLGVLGALVGGSLALPHLVYDRFVWQYFWGPVVADAHGAVCATREGGATNLLYDSASCSTATGPVAYPGYTVVSEVGYAVTLLFALVGVVFLLRRFDLGDRPGFLYALVPFMFFGGALRTVEDAMDAAVRAGAEPAISYPANALIISPVIYFTVFFITLFALVLSVVLARKGVVERYEYPLAAIGTIATLLTVGYLAVLAAGESWVTFYPRIALVIGVGSLVVTAGAWAGVVRFAPSLLAGSGRMGIVVLLGQIVDGVANVVGIDWAMALGRPGNLYPKHPANRFLIQVGEQFPSAVTDVIGTAWPFLLVKVAAALAVIWIFDEQLFEDSPRYGILLLVAIVAVGLGPGTRDMLRAMLGI